VVYKAQKSGTSLASYRAKQPIGVPMKVKYVLVSMLMAQGLLAQSAMAASSNRDGKDALFSEPKADVGNQYLLGLGEMLASYAVTPGMTGAESSLAKAEWNLKLAQDLPLTEGHRRATINAILQNPKSYSTGIVTPAFPEFLKDEPAQRLEALRSAPVVTKAEKAVAVQASETALSLARANALESLQKAGLIEKSVKVARYGASLILVGDVAARVYIWNAMDANPTLSPAATYLKSLLAK
jgi:hypothetical protein